MIKKQCILYALSNPSLPGLIKIGITKNLTKRLSQLFNTSIPTEFVVVDTIPFDNIEQARKSEKFLHDYLWLLRDNDNREFFTMTPEAARLLFDKYRDNALNHLPNTSEPYHTAQGDVSAMQAKLQELNSMITNKDSQLQLLNKAIALSANKYQSTLQQTAEISNTISSLSDSYAVYQDIIKKQEVDIKQKRNLKRNLDSTITLRQQEVNQLNQNLNMLNEKLLSITKLSLIDNSKTLQSNIDNIDYILQSYSIFNPLRYIKVRQAIQKTLKPINQ